MAEEKQTQRKSGKTNRLGRDFGALFSSASMTMENVETSVIRIKINDITPNSNQPRKNFDEESFRNSLIRFVPMESSNRLLSKEMAMNAFTRS